MTNQKRADRDKFYGEKGFALGTAILTATDLKEMYALVAKVVDSLSDPTSAVLRDRIERRLLAANIDIKNHTPIRSFANRSIISLDNVNQETLAHSNQLEKLETAISKRKAIRLQIQYKGKFRKGMDSRADRSEVWPLQILFHNIAWYLAYESKEPDSLGLLTVARLDRLKGTSNNQNFRL
jgi:WYL domain